MNFLFKFFTHLKKKNTNFFIDAYYTANPTDSLVIYYKYIYIYACV